MPNQDNQRTIIGLVEEVSIKTADGAKTLQARIDTGATKSSMDIQLAAELDLGPVIKSKLVKSAHGIKIRPVIKAEVTLKGKTIQSEFSLADRNHLKYPVLIGQNILKHGFMIDPSR